MDVVLRQHRLEIGYLEPQPEVRAEDQRLKIPPVSLSSLLSLDQIRAPNLPVRRGRALDHQSAGQDVLRQPFVGGGKIPFLVLPQHVERPDQTDVLALFQRQVESAQPEKGLFVRVRQGCFDAFLFDLDAQDRQSGVDPPETPGALERGARLKAVAEVNEQGGREQAVGPREERWLVEQDEVVDAAESICGGLPAGGLSLRLFGDASVWHDLIVIRGGHFHHKGHEGH